MHHVIALLLGLIAFTTGASAADTLKVAVAQRGFWNSSFVEFARQQGFFAAEGLEIEILYTEGGASTLTPVVAGSLDIAMTNGTLGVIAAYAKGMPVKIISAETRTRARAPMTMLLMTTPVSGPLPTIHGAMIIQMPRAHMAQLRPYMRSGARVNPSASRPIAMPMIRLWVMRAGWLAV
jgi:hypothetical protein